jgi:hypothetical protein
MDQDLTYELHTSPIFAPSLALSHTHLWATVVAAVSPLPGHHGLTQSKWVVHFYNLKRLAFFEKAGYCYMEKKVIK